MLKYKTTQRNADRIKPQTAIRITSYFFSDYYIHCLNCTDLKKDKVAEGWRKV
jgi:hypothetical protein